MKNKPLIVTEHGIYTKERQIDLYQVDWITESNPDIAAGLDSSISYIRQLWMQFFEGLGRLTYSASVSIVTLYEQNRQKQIDLGAPPDKSIVIPNGVNIERFASLRNKRSNKIAPVLCLLGRVVPIKDIKTYIRAIDLLRQQIPNAEGWIVGPEEEDQDYADECHALVKQLNLTNHVKFLGFQNIKDILPKMSLMTLSSISEGQPLVILEGYAAGVPVLSTDVGSCRELAEGRTEEDKALGSAGSIVPIANPRALADAAVALLNNEKRWYSAQASAIDRVEKYYGEQTFLDNYRQLYKQVLAHGRNRV
jgi:glycosyltransferase involved in cell wall biosynthesis